MLLPAQAAPGLRPGVAALLMQGVEGGSLPLTGAALVGAALPVGDEAGRIRVPILLETPGAPLLEFEGGASDGVVRLEFYAYAIDATGAVAAHTARAVDLRLSAWGEALEQSGVRLIDFLELPAGEYSLRLLVVEPVGRRYGMTVRDEVIANPTVAGGASSVATLHGESSCRSWLTAWPRERAIDQVGEVLPPSALVTTEIRPVFVADRAAIVRAVESASGDEWAARDTVVRLVQGDSSIDVPVNEIDVVALPAGRRLVRVEFQVPAMASGLHRVVLVEFGPEGPERERVAFLEAWIAAGAKGLGDCPSWASLRRLGAADSAARDPSLASSQAGELFERLTLAYRETLVDIATSGTLERAIDRLSALEKAVLDEESARLGDLGRAQHAVFREVYAVDSQAVLPILTLHHEAYEAYYERQLFALAGHSRSLVTAAAEWLLEEEQGWENPRPIADLLTSLADYAERHLMVFESQALLRRVLEFAPDHDGARLLLALSYERVGFHSRALDQLDLLREGNASLAEGRLRWAVARLRNGQIEPAVSELRRLVGEPVDDWIATLAFQALAQALGSTGRVEEAIATLERSVGLFPEQQRLHLLLAYWLSRSGRRTEAFAALDRMPVTGGNEVTSSRFRYAKRTSSVVAPLRLGLREGSSVRLPRLRVALEKDEGTARR